MWTTVRYIFLTAVRDWLFLALFLVLMLALGVSFFLGGTALVEEEQMRIAYISGASRVILLIGIIVFVCFHVRRAFDNREVEVILTRPISRIAFVLAYWLGFAVVASLFIIPIALIIWGLLDIDIKGLFFWTASLLLESYLLVAFALASSLMLRSAVTSVLISFSFYLVARMMGFFIAIVDKPFRLVDASASWFIDNILIVTSMLLPRLDLFGKGNWLIYGIDSDVNMWMFEAVPVFLMQSLIYIPFLLAMAVFDFKRKQF